MYIGSLYRFDKEEWVEKTGNWLIEKINQLIESNGIITIAISGGNTPLALFDHWVKNKKSVEWNRIKVFWVDERCVATNSTESNYGNALSYLVQLEGIQLFPMFVDFPEHLEQLATNYQDEICKYVKSINNIPTLDLMLLGMGNDGHYASLFPNSDGLNETERFVIVNWIAALNQNRLTMTDVVIQQATEVVVLVNDVEKNDLLSDVIFKRVDLPIQKIVRRQKPTTWIYSI